MSICQAVGQKTVTEAIIYYTVYLLELAVNVPNPDAGRKVSTQLISTCFFQPITYWKKIFIIFKFLLS